MKTRGEKEEKTTQNDIVQKCKGHTNISLSQSDIMDPWCHIDSEASTRCEKESSGVSSICSFLFTYLQQFDVKPNKSTQQSNAFSFSRTYGKPPLAMLSK